MEAVSGSRNEMSSTSRKVQTPNKYLLSEMVLETVKYFHILIFFFFFGTGLDFPTLKSPELCEC